jgi:hypothetical protein
MIITTISGGTDQSAPLDANTDFRIGERVRWGMTAMPYPETEEEPSF